MSKQTEVIIPAARGLRCVMWEGRNHWSLFKEHNPNDTADQLINYICMSVIGWSITDDDNKRPAPITPYGRHPRLADESSGVEVAYLHADGRVEWQKKFFPNTNDFLSEALKHEGA
ncbi:hypothetical protein ACT2FY_32340 [Paraburkholderia fungorum]|uniref:hypothetical protein n=1 Tax=Paraburkholderia fungorum TaxID=134537 RepID=UPI00402B0CFD